MPYPPRSYVPDMSVHVIRRGNNGTAIVGDDDDRRLLLRGIRRAARKQGTSVHAFVVMDTHYHLIVTPHSEFALPRMMKSVGERFVKYYNRKYERFGTLWAGRYRAIPLQDETQCLTCLRYIEQNPFRAKMVSAPDEYPWSSCRIHAHGEPSDWLVPHPVYLALGHTPRERLVAYRAICGVALSDRELAAMRHPAPGDEELELEEEVRPEV